jgi:hypothetical protein
LVHLRQQQLNQKALRNLYHISLRSHAAQAIPVEDPIFKGYQAKALPATKRQRLIQFPVWCYDIEKDRYNVQTGYEGRAWERIQTLEAIEAEGDIVNVQDFTTGERIQAIIERIDFSRKTPPSGQFDGFGGLLLVTVRSVL